MGTPMVIAVCDECGVLKALSRMDGAALLSVQIAQDKAYTAVGFGMSTDGWHEFIKNDPPLAVGAVGGIDRLVDLRRRLSRSRSATRSSAGSASAAATTPRTWRSPRRGWAPSVSVSD